MMDYIKAENLKCRRTFAKKLVLIAPLLMVLLASISGMYLVQNGYNWWYAIILPGFITLATALVNQIEERKLHYRTVFALPVPLQKIWISKVFLLAVYVLVACMLHLVGMILGKFLINPAATISITQMAVATLILIVVSLWQIPFCLFLSKKFGLMAAVIINLGMGIVLGIFAATKDFWWACPYSWATRLMCPVLGILPNGTMASQWNALLNPSVLPVGIVLSITLFVLLLAVTANWFQRQEAK
ncbi:ABC-2 family transporter protein [Clostridium liquoris]|jgi:ABC-2 type transport system permease protein|uniref:ABC-2 family transporter protein n=1 Tax=Clostridium liquoris TaxID=1289519 RepID=A0A2T0B2C3_9CLOT|nr:lantibiotic immunity ABC transporter MutE/EpiE family permease subunit [Clostridium liquoris]PRR78039.1 ABC-2 family transporter protein [Clostridium liquoris]